jgi:hypothetical protein
VEDMAVKEVIAKEEVIVAVIKLWCVTEPLENDTWD